MKKFFFMGMVIFLTLAMSGIVNATTLSFDFESGGSDPVSSTQGYKDYGFGNYFLYSDAVNSSLNPVNIVFNQYSGTSIDLKFNLAVIDSWDGTVDTNNMGFSPDYFCIKFDGNIIFSETFYAWNLWTLNNQSYKASKPLAPKGGNLGFSEFPDNYYLISLNGISSQAGEHTLSFYADGSGYQGGADESFGVDNINIAYTPEPATMFLFGLGLVGLAGVSRRKK